MKYLAIGAFTLLAATSQTLAHHPFDTEFDANMPVTITGQVTRVDWAMPHVVIHINATEAGATNALSLEAGSPSEMLSLGWTMDTLKKGETISVQGYRSKMDPTVVAARTIGLADGQKLAHGNDGGPQT